MGIALELMCKGLLLKGLEMLSRAITTLGAQPAVLVLGISHVWSSTMQFTQSWVSCSLFCCLTAVNLIAQLTWPPKHFDLLTLTFTVGSVYVSQLGSCAEGLPSQCLSLHSLHVHFLYLTPLPPVSARSRRHTASFFILFLSLSIYTPGLLIL